MNKVFRIVLWPFRFSKRMAKKVIRRLLYEGKKIYRKTISDKYHTKHITIDVRELFFQEHGAAGFNRYDMIVRYLSVENYYGKNDFGFEMEKKMLEARISKEESALDYISWFKDLIKSYEQNGYMKVSEIVLDKNLCLFDGSHRFTLGFYHGIFAISCAVRAYSIPIFYGLEWFIEKGFSMEELNILRETYKKIADAAAVPFVCILWPPVKNYFDEIVEKMNLIEKVIGYDDYEYDAAAFEKIVKAIYATDDIALWKVEKKMEYMGIGKINKLRVVYLNVKKPRFRLKSTNHTLSVRMEEIKQMIRYAYKDRIHNYYEDIIIHCGDNFHQNTCLREVFNRG